MANCNFSRAEAYAAILTEYREPSSPGTAKATSETRNQTGMTAGFRSTIERLLRAFHPTLVPPLPRSEQILFYYPYNPRLFRGWETLTGYKRGADEKVSRIIAYNSGKIDRLRQAFLWTMREFLKERDSARQSVIIGDIERLGVEWGICEARIEAAKLWFPSQRGK